MARHLATLDPVNLQLVAVHDIACGELFIVFKIKYYKIQHIAIVQYKHVCMVLKDYFSSAVVRQLSFL